MHIETIGATAIQPNTGLAGSVMPGDSLTIRNARADKRALIIAMWMTSQVAGFAQIAFPSGHDTTRGYRAGSPVGVNPGILPIGQQIMVRPQELLSSTLAGSNVAGDVEQLTMMMWYEDMPGISARLMTAAQLDQQATLLTTVETSITSTAGPSYGTELVITTGSDLLLANRDYAVLGMSSRTQVHSLNLKGPDLGNVRVSVPGVLRSEITSQWFVLLSRANGLPCIPIINSGNKSATFVGVNTDENAGTFLHTLYLALLK